MRKKHFIVAVVLVVVADPDGFRFAFQTLDYVDPRLWTLSIKVLEYNVIHPCLGMSNESTLQSQRVRDKNMTL